jgi:hypothetical protein
LVEVCGGYQISVFTSPTPCRVGTVDVSVMVQDVKTGGVLSETRVALIAAPRDRPSGARRYQASAAAATNKLLQAALIEIPSPGPWKIDVEVEGPQGAASVQCPIEVAPALPKWEALWGWIAWPGVVIALFALRVCVQPEPRAVSTECRSKP